MKVYTINKKIGETPLEALERLRKTRKLSAAAKLTYIGRLDPMASGVLLILQDATQKDREKYMGFEKTYEVKVLFGFETDSYDLLGLPKSGKRIAFSVKEIQKILNSYLGAVKLAVPPYSSIPYKGKPMFEWARMGKKVKLPVRECKVKSVKLKGLTSLSAEKLMSYIKTNIKKVKGDFRQEEILKAWNCLLCHPGIFAQSTARVSKNVRDLNLRKGSGHSGKYMLKRNSGMTTEKYLLSNITISVSSGTYIRSIAHSLGKKLKTGTVVYSLKRTRVGEYK